MTCFKFLLPLMVCLSVYAENCVLDGPVDLGRVISTNTISPLYQFTPDNITDAPVWNTDITFRVNSFCIGEHAGTHLDSPYHFFSEGWTVAQIPLERLFANGVLINVTEEAAGNREFRLQPHHIDRWTNQHGQFPNNSVLLISYGWAQLYENRTAYLGTTPEHYNNYTTFRFPGMTPATARKLSAMDQIVGIGVDTPSVDPSGSGDAHDILAKKNVYNLEHVNLAASCLPVRGFKVLSLPMKLDQGTGAPARVIATPEFQYTIHGRS